MTSLLQDIFIYFAKYPSADAVTKFFTKATGGEDYEKFKAATIAASKDKYPDISNYVLGANEASIEKKINSVKDIYMFIDYGNISTQKNEKEVKEDTFKLAITIAKPIGSNLADQAEEILLSDKLLRILVEIRNDMRNDTSDSFVERLLFPSEISPFFASQLSNSHGWTLMFEMKGIDWV